MPSSSAVVLRDSNPPHSPPRAFISYAREDGETFAAALRKRLEHELPDITLWQDRISMEGGVGWWKQITDALDRVEFLLMVITPGATASDVARKEWRYARQQGVRICPIMGVPADEINFGSLPSWMRRSHCYDLEREWPSFAGFLRSARKDNRVPFMAPDLREDFVKRPAELEALLSALLDRNRTDPLAITATLQGAGGFGKTTLATALCHHEEVIGAFDDGILWATLGQAPKIQDELTKLYAAVTGERPAFIDIEDAAIQLAERLDEKTCLIVLDDAWDPNHVKPFLRGARKCARLITTRMQQIVTDVAASRVSVDEMTVPQSVQMLASRLPHASGDFASLSTLARRLGEWPLLLKLAASHLRSRIERGASFESALEYVNRALDRRGVVGLDRTNPTARSDAVASTVDASLALVAPHERTRCSELAIFPRGVPIPLSAIAALCELDDFDSEELVQRLDGAALLDFDLKTGTIRMHDVLQSYMHAQLADAASVHARLVHRGWKDLGRLPDEYAWRWIGWHLLQAREPDRLRQLLLDYEWLAAKLAIADIEAVLADFELIAEAEGLRPVSNALRLASHGLARDADQLAAQLLGRLERGLSPAIDTLLARAAETVKRPWLRLVHRSLTHPGGALIAILKGHSAAVEAVAVTPDGSIAVSASSDSTLRLWEVATGKVIRALEGHTGPVYAVALSSDGRRAVSGSEDLTVRLWDLETGQVERVLYGHYGGVYGVAVSPDGAAAASVSDDGSVMIWNLASGEHRRIYKSSAHQLRSIVFTPCGRRVLFSNGAWTTLLLDLETGETVRTFEGHAGNARSLAVSADGRFLLTGGDDSTLRLWDIASGLSELVLEGHSGSIEAVALSPDGRRLISASKDHTLRVWDLVSGQVLQVLAGHSGFVRGVAVMAAPTLQAVSASSDRTLRHWSLASAAPIHATGTGLGPVSLLTISRTGMHAISGTRRGMLKVWQAEPGSSTSLAIRDGDTLVASWFEAAEARAMTQARDRSLHLWDLEAGAPVTELRGHLDRVRRIAISSDRTRAVTLARDRTLRAWDLASGRAHKALVAADNDRALELFRSPSALLAEMELVPQLDISPATISREAELALSADGRKVLLGSQNQVIVWDIATGQIGVEQVDEFDTVSVTIAANNQFAVIASRFGALRILDLATARTVLQLEGHSDRILDVVIDADGRRAISASRDNTIRVWDLNQGRQRALLASRWAKIDEVAIAPNGEFAYSVYGDTVLASRLDTMAVVGSLSFDHLITALAVSPDGRHAAIGDDSGQVHFLVVEN